MKRILLTVSAAMLTVLSAATTVLAQIPPAPGTIPPPGFSGMPPGYANIPNGSGAAGPGAAMMGYPDPQAAERAAENKAMMDKYKSQYGVSPVFKRIFCGKDCTTCNGQTAHKGLFKNLCNKMQGPIAPPFPVGQGGTLVFPQHPFVRSPRDFFMYD